MKEDTYLTEGYTSPEVTITTFLVERGFAQTGGNSNFEDGGTSPWD